jgi:hypothetical protein
MALYVFLAAPKPFEVALKRVGVAKKEFGFGLDAFLAGKKGVFGGLNVCEIGSSTRSLSRQVGPLTSRALELLPNYFPE